MSKKVLKLESKKAPKVKITNFMIERFEQETAFIKLRRPLPLREDEIKMGKPDFNLEYRLKIFKLSEILMNSPEARAFNRLKNELIKIIEEKKQIEVVEEKERLKGAEQKEVDKAIRAIEVKEQLTYNHPKVLELMNLETGLELDKLVLQVNKLPGDFTPEDMMITSWLIEYVEDTNS